VHSSVRGFGITAVGPVRARLGGMMETSLRARGLANGAGDADGRRLLISLRIQVGA